MNWKGKPLVNHETIIKLIASTKTANGLTITAGEDNGEYATGIRYSHEEMTKLNIKPHEIHPKWNYMIHPQKD